MQNVSVIIPSYNRAHTLERAIDSVLIQSVSPHEIILIDDGSTDETAALIKNKYSSIHYIYQENSGVSHARNTGIRQAKNPWIALLDSDDAWLPNKLQAQMSAIEKSPSYQICHTNETWIRHGVRVNPMKKHLKKGGNIYQHCLPLCAISPSSTLISRELLNSIGLFDETLPACEDYDLWLRITSQHPVLYLEDELIVKYGGHEDQLSRKFWGMDRFRIQALINILDKNILNISDQQATIDILKEKLFVYLQGAKKRNKENEIATYEEILHKYS